MVVCVFDFDISVASVSDIQRSMSTALYYNVGLFVSPVQYIVINGTTVAVLTIRVIFG
jgi:hypothetical protein